MLPAAFTLRCRTRRGIRNGATEKIPLIGREISRKLWYYLTSSPPQSRKQLLWHRDKRTPIPVGNSVRRFRAKHTSLWNPNTGSGSSVNAQPPRDALSGSAKSRTQNILKETVGWAARKANADQQWLRCCTEALALELTTGCTTTGQRIFVAQVRTAPLELDKFFETRLRMSLTVIHVGEGHARGETSQNNRQNRTVTPGACVPDVDVVPPRFLWEHAFTDPSSKAVVWSDMRWITPAWPYACGEHLEISFGSSRLDRPSLLLRPPQKKTPNDGWKTSHSRWNQTPRAYLAKSKSKANRCFFRLL